MCVLFTENRELLCQEIRASEQQLMKTEERITRRNHKSKSKLFIVNTQ
jgi:hypothetical protein